MKWHLNWLRFRYWLADRLGGYGLIDKKDGDDDDG
jgi:hypothetical protein